MIMKLFNIFLMVSVLAIGLSSCKGETIAGEYYGQAFEQQGDAVDDRALYAGIKPSDTLQTQMIGEIKEVCQNKGCWMKVALAEDQEEVFVRFKDYAFFVPKDVAGKKVVLNGAAFLEEMSVEDQRHYAEDDGATPEEIAQITAPKRTYRFEADGVLIGQ